jgi:hypothetical protein
MWVFGLSAGAGQTASKDSRKQTTTARARFTFAAYPSFSLKLSGMSHSHNTEATSIQPTNLGRRITD